MGRVKSRTGWKLFISSIKRDFINGFKKTKKGKLSNWCSQVIHERTTAVGW